MRKEALPTELVVVVILSLAGFILLFAAMVGSDAKPSVQGHTLKELLQDKVLDDTEMRQLSGMSCSDIKEMMGTDRNVCIYLKDADGNLVTVGSQAGFGCPGVRVDGTRVCG